MRSSVDRTYVTSDSRGGGSLAYGCGNYEELDVVVKLPLADEILYLILELAIVGVVSYVAVIATILVLVPLSSLLLYGKGSSEVDPPFIRLKHLSSIGVQLDVVGVSSQ